MQRLFKLLSSVSSAKLTADNTTVSEPMAASGHGWQNTMVILTGTFSQGTYFKRPFYYRRFNLGHHPLLEVPYRGESQYLDFLDQMNKHLSLTSVLGVGLQSKVHPMVLTSNDMVNLAYTPAPPGMTRVITIQADPHSYVFTGELKVAVKTPLPPPPPMGPVP